MSDWDDNADSNSGDQNNNSGNNSGGGLRKQLEQTLARLKTLEDENATLKTQTRQAAVSTLLEKKNLSAKVATLIPATVEPTEAAVDKWLEEYGEVFNIKKETTAGSEDAGGAESGTDVDFEAQQEYIQTMRQMGNIQGAVLAPVKATELLAKINDPALTHEGLIKLIEQHGGGAGMG